MPSLFPEPTQSSQWINAHCDGGARGNPGPAGYGALIQDDAGNVLAELSEFLGHKTNNFAEYSGLLGCLQWALDHGHTHLRVVSDSELMVKQIQGKYKVNSPDLRPLWEEARRRIAKLDGFQISHALRHKNKDADRLANEAMDVGTGKRPAPRALCRRARPGQATSRPAPEAAASGPKWSVDSPATATVHLLGGAKLPDGVFVKVIVE